MKPFVKWAGGKRQILSRINEYVQDSIDNNPDYTYIEPFLGGGAVFFSLHPKKAIINDLNEDLINAYRIIKSGNYSKLIDKLKEFSGGYHNAADEFYYHIREWDRVDDWMDAHDDVDRAARMIFLNHTCYNGLYRVNSKGQFNTPMGRYRNPLICDETNIKEIHEYLSNPENHIEIMNGSYEDAIKKAKDGDVIYIDPPYDYEDDDGFTKYQMSGFSFEDFQKLKEKCDKAVNKGAFVIISNNATTKVMKLFEEDPKYKIFYDPNCFTSLRSINCKGDDRRTGSEVIFWGMNNSIPFPQANDIDKVITLVQAGDEIIENKEKAKEVINVGTPRQVSYYLSALQYLKYLGQNKKLTERALKLKNSKPELVSDIYNQLLEDKLFGKAYHDFKVTGKVNIDKVTSDLKKENQRLSESTLRRRASTIRSWVEWMYEIDKVNKMNPLL
ncbi:MAG: Dam family site-specific DNA-(adenine-N6)-methyltransferase [Erysipelotrichaceae bacterium]|nr:Dam family site-specific DNA-(adenine-N6)-methyltransferase [Erysipelotrichaceae bacterium]MDD6802431.1 Dam family site-specific DNA-(adenine-N6)-methyltransferase [Mollicutes bacterium]